MERFFKVDALTDWHRIAAGEILKFPSEAGPRRVRLYVSSNDMVEVWAGNTDAPDAGVLVAHASGQFSVEYTADGESFVQFLAADDAAVFARGASADHRVAATDDQAFTSIAPRSRRNSDLDRMMMLMRYNEVQREARYQADLAALAAQIAAKPVQAVTETTTTTEGGGGAA